MREIKDNKSLKRRQFIKKAGTALGLLAGLELLYMSFSFIKPNKSNSANSPDNYFKAGMASDFMASSITPFNSRHFFLICDEKSQFHALSSRCTHLGCTLSYDKSTKLFHCPCHSSTFDLQGRVLRSPASKNLEKLKVFIDKGIVIINTNPKKEV